MFMMYREATGNEELSGNRRKAPSSGAYIAIIDDLESNRTFLEHLARLLPEVGQVTSFACAEHALAAFEEQTPDLVITDFDMPGMNAAEFLESFRHTGEFEEIPVIVVSSHSESANRYRALHAGATDFLIVPLDTLEFNARTRNLLRLRQHQKILRSQSLSLRSELVETRHRSMQTRHRFIGIIDSVPALIFAVDRAGLCVFANQYCFEFLGAQKEEGLPGVQFLAERAGAAVKEAMISDSTSLGAEIALTGRDGREHSFLVIAKSVTGGLDDELTVYSGIEISQLKTTERSLRKAKEEAELANRAKSAFLSNMTHEIRTPLNAIIGFTDAIHSEIYGPLNNDRYREYIADVQTSAHHLLSVVNEILDLSQIEANRHSVHPTRFSLTDCLGNVSGLLKNQLEIQGNHIELRDIPELTIDSDHQKLAQVFLNVLTNANKSMTGGTIAVSAARSPAGGLIITIADQGRGMDDEELALAVTEYGRVSQSAFISSEQPGTGLGLPISIGFMKLLGGKLEIESRKGDGTCVRIALPPQSIVGEEPRGDDAAAGSMGGGEGG